MMIKHQSRQRRASKPESVTWLLTWLSAAMLVTTSAAFGQEIFYVDPSGSDANPGTQMQPLRTFQGAVDSVRPVLDGAGDVTVNFNDGTYIFEQTVVLGLADSGGDNQAVTYRASPGASPIFSSLVQVTGWSVFQGEIMQATLPAGLSHVRYLQDASETWMERSATAPFVADETANCIECTWDDPAFQANKLNVQYPGSFAAPDWALASQYDLRESPHAWTLEVLPIASVNAGDRRIFTTIPALYEMRRDIVEGDIPNNFWVLNSLEGITEPGRWASLNGTLYLWPSSGTGDIFVPGLTELIRVDEGTADGNQSIATPVQNIHLEGITFTGGDFYVMKTGDVTTQHDWSVVDEATALLRLRNVAGSSVRACTFTRSGSTGVRLDRYAQGITIENNTFSYLGREAVVLTGRAPSRGDVSTGNSVSFNHISATGREKWTAPAIMVDQSSNNTISSNYITDTYFTTIALTSPRQLAMLSVGETGGPGVSTVREFHYQEIPQTVVDFVQSFEDLGDGSREAMQFVYNYDNRVSDNALVDTCKAQGFLVNGYVYVSGAQRGGTNFLERNYVYDSVDNLQNNMAFYSDSDQDNCEYIGNMIHHLEIGDAPAPFPMYAVFAQWAESEPPDASGRILLRANMTEDSTFGVHVDGLDTVQEGNIINGSGGSATFLPVYESMYSTLCVSATVPGSPWPGSADMQSALAAKIVTFGGTVPSCTVDLVFADDFESGDASAWSAVLP